MRPRPRPAHPVAIDLLSQQCCDRKGECNRKTDIAHVQHRRVNDQPWILQQGVQVQAINGGGHQAVEWIGCKNHEHQESGGNPAKYRKRTGPEIIGQLLAEQGHGEGP